MILESRPHSSVESIDLRYKCFISSSSLHTSADVVSHNRWIANYHLHESLLQENEEEKLSKEEQDMAWEVYRKSLEWEEVQRVPIGESVPDPKPEVSKAENEKPELETWQLSTKLRNRFTKRQCTNLAHLLTLRSQRIKIGGYTVCGECARVVRWEDLKK